MKTTVLMEKYETELAKATDPRLLKRYRKEIERACTMALWIERLEDVGELSEAASLLEWMNDNGYVVLEVVHDFEDMPRSIGFESNLIANKKITIWVEYRNRENEELQIDVGMGIGKIESEAFHYKLLKKINEINEDAQEDYFVTLSGPDKVWNKPKFLSITHRITDIYREDGEIGPVLNRYVSQMVKCLNKVSKDLGLSA